jgi:hypothetical protein
VLISTSLCRSGTEDGRRTGSLTRSVVLGSPVDESTMSFTFFAVSPG